MQRLRFQSILTTTGFQVSTMAWMLNIAEMEDGAPLGAPQGKKRKGNKEAPENRIARITLKMCLQHAQFFRAAHAIIQDTLEMDTDHIVIKQIAATGKMYHNETQRLGKGHRLGMPYIHSAGIMIKVLAGLPLQSQQHLVTLQQAAAKLQEENGNVWLAEHISKCRIKEIRKEDKSVKTVLFLQCWPQGQVLMTCILELLWFLM